jgi:hypothetical protein
MRYEMNKILFWYLYLAMVEYHAPKRLDDASINEMTPCSYSVTHHSMDGVKTTNETREAIYQDTIMSRFDGMVTRDCLEYQIKQKINQPSHAFVNDLFQLKLMTFKLYVATSFSGRRITQLYACIWGYQIAVVSMSGYSLKRMKKDVFDAFQVIMKCLLNKDKLFVPPTVRDMAVVAGTPYTTASSTRFLGMIKGISALQWSM